MSIRFLAAADADVADAVNYYDAQRSGLGSEFVAEVERTVARILEHPAAWSLASKRCRSCQTKRFPHSIIYRVQDDETLIVAVMHNRREPRIWEERIS